MFKTFVAAVVLLAVVAFGVFYFKGKSPELRFLTPVTAVGSSTPVAIQVDDAHGIKSFKATLQQEGQSQTIAEENAASPQTTRTFNFTVGKKAAPFLKEGSAKLLVEAKSNDFRGEISTLSQDLQVVLRQPTIVADGRQHYINQGGGELVTLELGGNWTDAGVRVAKYTAATFAMPGQPENSPHRFSLFPFPWDVPADTVPVAFVRNGAGTEVTTTFWVKVFPKQFRRSDIQLNDKNMQKVVGELDPEGTGSLVERFVRINNETRKANTKTIYDLRLKTEHKILWSGPFVPIKGTRESYFADDRSYYYQGKKVDEQVHLGFDLAQTANMSVTAANSGKVIYADRLGIYGNCVIIDHGYTLQTLYGHMSRIDVKVGDMVQKQQHIGVSGSTGMAFGDHVHFSMLIAGYQVNPIEWWDEHWIKDRILSKIGDTSQRAAAPTGPPPPMDEPAHAHKKHRRR